MSGQRTSFGRYALPGVAWVSVALQSPANRPAGRSLADALSAGTNTRIRTGEFLETRTIVSASSEPTVPAFREPLRGSRSGGRSSTRTATLLIRLRNVAGSVSSASSTSLTNFSRSILRPSPYSRPIHRFHISSDLLLVQSGFDLPPSSAHQGT